MIRATSRWIDPAAPKRRGLYRLARGEAFFAYMKARHPTGLNQRMVLVPGVAHSSVRMFGSVCGMAVLFDRSGCPPD